MLIKRNKKIFFYIFVFLIIGTLNNKDIKKMNIFVINNVSIKGLDNKDNIELLEKLNFLKLNNLFFLNEFKIIEILNSNNLVEDFSIFKKYPSGIDIKINKARILAKVKKDEKHFFLGSNGKLIEIKNIKKDVPFLYGFLNIDSFFNLKKIIDESDIRYDQIKNLFFFKSGRWDIEMNSGLVIKLGKTDIKNSINLVNGILNKTDFDKIDIIDFRQNNQIIIDGR